MKKLLALLLTLCLVIGMVPLAASAAGEGTGTKTDPVTTAEQLKQAVESATGATTIYVKGTIDFGNDAKSLSVQKPISLAGADSGATIKGQIIYSNFGSGDNSDTEEKISWSGITMEPAGANTTNLGVCLSTGVNGYTFTLENCSFSGYNYAVAVNSGASNNKVVLKGVSFKDNGCAVSVKFGNTVEQKKGTTIEGGYAGQLFGTPSPGAASYDGYYDNLTDLSTDQTMGNVENAVVNISSSEGNKVVMNESDLRYAVTNATAATTIYLGKDITLTAPINLESNDNITINGNGNTITFAGTGECKTVFTAPSGTEVEGIPADVTLTVNNVNFMGQGKNSGYAAIVGGNAKDTKVTFTGCKFEGLYCGVYVNQQNKDSKPTVTITGSTFENTKYVTSVDTVTPGVDPSATTVVTENNTLGEGTQEQEVFENIILKKKDGSQTVYSDFQQALTAASAGDTILLNKDVELSSKLTIDKAITIEGNGESTIKLTGEVSTGAFIEISGDDANNVTLKNLTVDTNKNAKHGIQFYCVEGGTLENVTVNGGYWTSVIVNGSTGITIKGCELNPIAATESKTPYAHIEYAMGSGVTTIPSITVNDNTYENSSVPQIYADSATTAAINTAKGGNQSAEELRAIVMENIKNEGTTDVKVTILVKEAGDEEPTVDVETSEGENKPDPEPTDPPVVYPTTYKTTVEECEGGSVVASPSSAREGQKVTLTVKPQAGQELKSLKVTDKDGDAVTLTKVEGGYTFKMPKGGVTVTALFGCDGGAACPSKGFTDLDSDKWYHEYMDYAVEQGLLEGTSPTTMEPNATLTRAQLAQILYNLEGKPQVQGDLDFTDVAEGKWYYAAILWANQEGVVNGMSPDTFAPNEDISRQDLALMLYRYAGEPTVTGDLDGFKDAGQVGDWAQEAITWAVEEGIIDGMTPTTLEPTGTATRAQAAAMLQRFLEG